MELTLTGASLNTDGRKNQEGKQCCHNHEHEHEHEHHHNEKPKPKSEIPQDCGNGDKQCCASHGQNPSNFRTVESIPLDKLLGNPPVLFAALIASVKGGKFATYKYLVDAVLKHEQQTQAPMAWGVEFPPESGNKCKSALGRRAADGHTIAHWSAKREDEKRFIEYLADNVENIDLHITSADKVGMTPLHWAATEGSIPIVNLILKHLDEYPSPIDTSSAATSETGMSSRNDSSLMLVNDNDDGDDGNRRMKVPPLDKNSPINVRDKSGCTPLLIASQYGHADLTAFLIKRGANPNAVDDSGDTALHWAAYKGAVPVCGLLLHLNGVEDHLDIVDAFGQTALHLASLRGNDGVVTYIMEQAEAYAESQASKGKSGFMAGAGSQQPQSVSLPSKLLCITDRDGKSTLDLAVKKKRTNTELILKQYIDKHCDVDRSIMGKSLATIKLFCSCKSWLSWLGMVNDNNGRPPKFLVWFVGTNTVLALIYELLVYISIPLFTSVHEQGRLWDYMGLHIATVMGFLLTLTTFILVNRTDPGLLAKKNSASIQSSSGFSLMFGCGENKRIRREMHTLTNDLRNLYEETLESFTADASTLYQPNKLTLCHSCHIARPYRAKHCRVLNRCILLFDHHCPFVGTTIGLYNYKYFYVFVLSFTITEILFIATWILYLKSAPEGTGRETGKILIGLYFAIYTLMTLPLAMYHTQLIHNNLTTNEHQNLKKYKYLQNQDGSFKNPFNRGFLRNLMSRFCPAKDAYMLITKKSGPNDHEKLDVFGADKKNDDDEKMRLIQNAV